MADFHDKIFDENKQSETYNSITVSHFTSNLDMEGGVASLADAIHTGKLLRVTDCYLKPEKNVHFEKIQYEIWISGMKNSEGMLRGIFSKALKNNVRYLVTSFWDSTENHDYVANMLPEYREKDAISNDIEYMTVRTIELVDSWKIIKQNNAT